MIGACNAIVDPTERDKCQLKSLADFKRILVPGQKFLLKSRFGKPVDTPTRVVAQVQSNAVKFKVAGTDGNERDSWLEFPKASLLEFDGRNVRIYSSGLRDLTDEERRLVEKEPKDAEQDRVDMMTDGSTMFYRRKAYYRSVGKEYLFGGSKPEKGMLLTWQGGERKIRDDKVKGDVSLEYEVAD